MQFALRGLNVFESGTQGCAGSEIERKGDGRKYSLMIHGKRGILRLVVRKRAERDKLAGFGWNINGSQSAGIFLRIRRDLEDDVILVETFIDVRNLALAKCVAKGVVDVENRNFESRGSFAIDDQ